MDGGTRMSEVIKITSMSTGLSIALDGIESITCKAMNDLMKFIDACEEEMYNRGYTDGFSEGRCFERAAKERLKEMPRDY